MQLPTIHLNGTSKNDLREQWAAASQALRAAEDALSEAGPHGRDYYVQSDPNAYTKARDEHVARIDAVRKVRLEIEQLWEGVENATGDRR